MSEWQQAIQGDWRLVRHAGAETWYRAVFRDWVAVPLRTVPLDAILALTEELNSRDA